MGVVIHASAYTPNWSPNWADVNFDHAKADELITALKALWAAIDTATSKRMTLAQPLVDALGPVNHDSWTGNDAAAWRTAYHRQTRTAGTLHQRIDTMITGLSNAAHRATTEQAARVADRKRWTTENNEGTARMQSEIKRLEAQGTSVTVI